MSEIVPSYYSTFRCIADRCRHSCCIGWEIDVDPDSLSLYRTLPGALGDEIRLSLVAEDDCTHFRLKEHDRCPFLNEQGLCRMILAHGDGILCQICRDHPRFYSEFSDHTEVGLGLCCEEAARLILTQPRPMTLLTLEDDGAGACADEFEQQLLSLRRQLFSLLEDESWTVDERLTNLLDLCGIALPDKTAAQWADIYRSLERLDESWDDALTTLTHYSPFDLPDRRWDLPFLQLTAYFLYRHLPSALEDGDAASRVGFAVLSVRILRMLFAAAEEQTMDTLIELVRMYSSEIEYSTENVDTLINVLWS